MDRDSQRVQMADEVQAGASPAQSDLSKEEEAAPKPGGIKWTRYLGLKGKDSQALEERWAHREKWSMGILSDKHTDEVPGTSTVSSSLMLMAISDTLDRNHLAARCKEK